MNYTIWDIEYALNVFHKYIEGFRGDVMRVPLPVRHTPSLNESPVAYCEYKEVVFRKNWNTKQWEIVGCSTE